mmetsp:Transcript_16911/g.40314  ORF Transcript_16911/g.40314 Transcript_16911/m.40314 type:complete len:245 (-) Transcript_16911:219-953(-)
MHASAVRAALRLDINVEHEQHEAYEHQPDRHGEVAELEGGRATLRTAPPPRPQPAERPRGGGEGVSQKVCDGEQVGLLREGERRGETLASAMLQQHLHHRLLLRVRRQHQGRRPVVVLRLDVSIRRQQSLHHAQVAHCRSHQQRGEALLAVPCIHRRARRDELRGTRLVALGARPHERGQPVHLLIHRPVVDAPWPRSLHDAIGGGSTGPIRGAGAGGVLRVVAPVPQHVTEHDVREDDEAKQH